MPVPSGIPIYDALNSFLNQRIRPEIVNMFSKQDPYIHVDAITGSSSALGTIQSGGSSGAGYWIPSNSDFVPPATVRDVYEKSNTAPTADFRSPSTPQQIQYFDAPFAEMYGMSAETAYQEALANTAYQRKVADLKAAGLNPVLGISGSGAASFYGQSAGSTSYGSLGSGASLSRTASKLSYSLPQFLNGLVNMVVTASTGNSMSGYGAGFVAQNISSGVLNYLKNSDK